MSEQKIELPPEVGQAIRIRNRLGVVRAVDAYDGHGQQGRLNLVTVEYLDDCAFPESDQILWEAELSAKVLGATSLPSVDASRPDDPASWQSFINAHCWTRLNRLHASSEIGDDPILGVWNSAIQVHTYQLEPVIRALQMPRVSLLLADGVGLGKTIQAGLVLEELLLRRRIRRVLVLCPAMLQRQWKIELRRKFNLDFEIIDSESSFQLRRRLGIDTNPWKAYPRVIASMDYLRMPDILQQFLQASGAGDDLPARQTAPLASWDLLIVDEAHHFAPQGGGRASQRTQMLREIRFLFEHRIFASATPHNGKTVCFTGLLELLDPVRFQMRVEMDPDDKRNLSDVRIRRLKEDVNAQSIRPPFADQKDPVALKIALSPAETALYAALREYRLKGVEALAQSTNAERWLGQFIFSLFTKRLLSCPYAFARTWWRHLEEETEEQEQLFDMARVSAEQAEDEARSDDEKSRLEEDAARFSGAWLRSRQTNLKALQGKINAALSALGLDRKAAEDEGRLETLVVQKSAKTDALVAWIKENLFVKGALRDDERLIVFTEYKETLFYLEKRMLQEGFDENTLRMLFGGMDADEFEAVKAEFEDPAAPVRLLLATDAASEGINMQESCRWVIHYDIPWSPSRIQQRNGRVSRHGQVRDVYVHYFRCDQEEDMEFLYKVAVKVEQVRQDLGSVERVFDAAIQRHFLDRSVLETQLIDMVDKQRGNSLEKEDLGQSSAVDVVQFDRRARELLENTDSRLSISPEALEGILRSAIATEGQGALEDVKGKPGFFRLKPPPRWEGLARQTLSSGDRHDRAEIVFDAARVTEEINNRSVMRLKKHQVLLRLGHPVMRQALAALSRQLHDPSPEYPINRWTLAAIHKQHFEALLIFHYSVTAVNELREPLHDEVLSTVFRVENERLVPVDDAFQRDVLTAQRYAIKDERRRENWVRTFRLKWPAHSDRLKEFLKTRETEWKTTLTARAAGALERETDTLKKSYALRLHELKERMREKELRKLASELSEEKHEAEQSFLFGELEMDAKAKLADIETQMELLKRDVDATRSMLERERDHRLKSLLPRRYQLREVRILPLALAYIIPTTAEDMK